jgi:hypothetical protein
MPSHYKAYFQKAMQERARDLSLVGFASDAKALLARVQTAQAPRSAPVAHHSRETASAFEGAWLQTIVPEFLRFLKAQKSKIPVLEYAGLERAAANAKTLEDLREVRSRTAERVLQVLRLRAQTAPFADLALQDSDIPLGPYNSRRALQETLALASDDPLWISDFLSLYAEALDL